VTSDERLVCWCEPERGEPTEARLPDARLIAAAGNSLEPLLRVAELAGAYHDAQRDGTSTDAYTARERLFDAVKELGMSPTDRALVKLSKEQP
jgi:hypothetical protein